MSDSIDSANSSRPNDRSQIAQLFSAARRLPRQSWRDYLTQHCDSESLRQEVLELLHHDRDDGFLEEPILKIDWRSQFDQDKSDPPTTQAIQLDRTPDKAAESPWIDDRYRLQQRIGEGGFGVVYMAEQTQPIRRRVAVKLLKSGMDSKSVVARFESERQALAMMDHPNIAKIFDGGITREGRSYFVMELVQGVPITDFCNTHHLDTSSRMRLLVDVCNAVQHAHQKGVIHRDLKPSNILVTLLDGRPTPKVIDFGIAKALFGPLTDKTLFTEFRQMIGTPEYMSPEQAETSALDADTRSDVYSLGVLAYELLTGTTPFDGRALRQLSFGEMQRTIREVEPPRPSQRVSSLIGPNLHHGQQAHAPISNLRGDLDWIVMKAIDKDRNRRYSSAEAMAQDVNRWMANEPIEARPPSLIYKSQKWIRRHRKSALVGLLLLIGGLMAAGGIGFGISERIASRERLALSRLRGEDLQRSAELETKRVAALTYGNTMIGACESFQAGRRSSTLQLLAECPEENRGVEWKWMSYMASDRSVVLKATSDAESLPINAVQFLPTGDRLVAIGADGMVRIWDVTHNRLLRSWLAHEEASRALAVSCDGLRILTGSDGGSVALWDAASGSQLAETQTNQPVALLSIDAAGELIGIGGASGSIEIWDGELTHRKLSLDGAERNHQGPIQSILFDSVTHRILTAGKGGVLVWDRETGKQLAVQGDYWQSYGALTAPNFASLAVFGPPIAVFDATGASPVEKHVWNVSASDIVAADFDALDGTLVIATEDEALQRIGMESGLQETLAYGNQGAIHDLSVEDRSGSIAIAGHDGSVRFWERNQLPKRLRSAVPGDAVAQVAANDLKTIVVMDNSGRVHTWNGFDHRVIVELPSHSMQGFSVDITRDGNRIISYGLDQVMRIWSTEEQRMLGEYPLSLGARYIRSHPDGKHVASPMPRDISEVASDKLSDAERRSGDLALWDIDQGRVVQCFDGLTNWAMHLEFSDDGKFLLAATVSDGAVVWRLSDNLRWQFQAPNRSIATRAILIQDQNTVLTGHRDGHVHAWDLETGKHLRTMVCHGDEITCLMACRDSNRILTGCKGDSRLRIWDWTTGQYVGLLDTGVAGISSARMTQDQSSIVIGGTDGGIRVLEVAPR